MLAIRFMLTLLENQTVYPDAVSEDRWLPITVAPTLVAALVADWLREDRLTCCSFQGGFWITINGQDWNQRTTDEFWMTLSWLHGLSLLLNGAQQTTVHFWEEGSLKLERDGDVLMMTENERHLKISPAFCPPVIVSFTDFTRQIARESQFFADWVRALHAEIARRQSPEAALAAIKALGTTNVLPTTDTEKLGKILWEVPSHFIEDIEKFSALVHTTLGN